MKTPFQSRWLRGGVPLAMMGALAWMLVPFAWSNRDHNHGEKGPPTRAEEKAHETEKHEEKDHADEARPHGMPEKPLSSLAARGKQLVKNFHCDSCHVQIEEEGHVHAHAMPAPDITFLGDKLRPDWLYDYLKKPHILRPWLKLRMPDFRLTDREALALTKHIVRTMRDRRLRPLRAALEYRPDEASARVATGKKWFEKFKCAKCHPTAGTELKELPEGVKEADLAPPFNEAVRRLNPNWTTRFLLDPQSIYPGTRMPNFFFDEGDPLLEGAEEMMVSVRDYLFSRAPERPMGYYEAFRRYPEVSAAEGDRVMDELNCAGCHNVRGFHRTLKVGPVLTYEGSKVRKDWLVDFLRNPYTIRPDGYRLGSKARMPNFFFTEPEVQAISAYMMSLKDEGPHPIKPTSDPKVVAEGKALFDRLACGACHTTKGHKTPVTSRGFRGPNLTKVANRLQGEHLVKWLSDPKVEDAHPIVPNYRLTDDQLRALVSYLMTLD